MPDGPEREALFLEAKRIAVAYMPYKFNVHRICHRHRRIRGWSATAGRCSGSDWWHMVDIDDNPAGRKTMKSRWAAAARWR